MYANSTDASSLCANFHHSSFKIVACIDGTKLALAKFSRSITSRSRSKSKFRKFIQKRIVEILLCATFYHTSFEIVAYIDGKILSPHL